MFSYNGKSYNTKLASDTPKKGPVPKSRQGQDSGSGGRATKAAPAKKAGAPASETKKVLDHVNKKNAKPMQGPKKSNAGASYPKAENPVGIAKKGSILSKAQARRANAPKKM